MSDYVGKLAVVLESGLTEVKLAYRSFTLRIGAIISLATAGLALLLARRQERS